MHTFRKGLPAPTAAAIAVFNDIAKDIAAQAPGCQMVLDVLAQLPDLKMMATGLEAGTKTEVNIKIASPEEVIPLLKLLAKHDFHLAGSPTEAEGFYGAWDLSNKTIDPVQHVQIRGWFASENEADGAVCHWEPTGEVRSEPVLRLVCPDKDDEEALSP